LKEGSEREEGRGKKRERQEERRIEGEREKERKSDEEKKGMEATPTTLKFYDFGLTIFVLVMTHTLFDSIFPTSFDGLHSKTVDDRN
jgi:hypothetical protein